MSYWAILNCPHAGDYTLDRVDKEGQYHYTRNPVGAAKRANSHEELTLPHPIEEHPTALQTGSEALEELYGPGTTETLDRPRGFGL